MIKKPGGPEIPEPIRKILCELIDEVNDIQSIIFPLIQARDARIEKEKAKEAKRLKDEAEALARQQEIEAAKKRIADAEAKARAEAKAKAEAEARAKAEAERLAADKKLLKEISQ